MKSSQGKTVGELAAENTAAARVFQKHGIEFCCGGKRSLAEVCRERGIDQEALLAEIESAASPKQNGGERDWGSATLTELMNHIVAAHHEFLKLELPRLAETAAKVRSAHGDNHPEVITLEQMFLGLQEELHHHLMKEEMVLFPLIERMEAASRAGAGLPPAHCGSVNNPIRVMEYEHDSAGQTLQQMRHLTNGYTPPEDACSTFRALYERLKEVEADLHQHIHLENNILHPRASRLEAGF